MLRRTLLKALLFSPIATLIKPEPVEATLEATLEGILDKYSPLYLSKESADDLKNWGVDQVDQETKNQIMADALSGVLRQGVMDGDITNSIFITVKT